MMKLWSIFLSYEQKKWFFAQESRAKTTIFIIVVPQCTLLNCKIQILICWQFKSLRKNKAHIPFVRCEYCHDHLGSGTKTNLKEEGKKIVHVIISVG